VPVESECDALAGQFSADVDAFSAEVDDTVAVDGAVDVDVDVDDGGGGQAASAGGQRGVVRVAGRRVGIRGRSMWTVARRIGGWARS
jgi:hypothetical protein